MAFTEPTWLDPEHLIEPADPSHTGDDPLVVDAAGRMWRLRYRPAWGHTLGVVAPVLLGVVLLALLLLHV